MKNTIEVLRVQSWKQSKLNFIERTSLLQTLKEQIQAYESQIIQALAQDFGKPPFEAYITELFTVYKEIDIAIKNIKHWMKPVKVQTPAIMFGAHSQVQYVAKGLVLIISPWNYPFQLAISPLVAALAAGNTVVLKPSEITAHTSKIIEKIFNHPQLQACVGVIQGGAEVTQKLIDFGFDHIFFTGSTRVGRLIMAAAAKHLTSVTLELGGKSPVIIDQKTDVQMAAKSIVWGKYLNAGQTCLAPDYIYVHQSQLSELIEELTRVWKSYRQDSKDYTSMVTVAHLDRLQDIMTQAQSTPGVSLYPIDTGLPLHNNQMELTLVVGDFEQLRIGEEEIFGPLLPIKTYQSLPEIFEQLYKKDYPLALYIYSKQDNFINEVISNTRSGGVCVNDVIVHVANPYLPFGGVGASGVGSYHGFFGYKAFSHERAVFKQSVLAKWGQMAYPPYTLSKQKMMGWVTGKKN